MFEQCTKPGLCKSKPVGTLVARQLRQPMPGERQVHPHPEEGHQAQWYFECVIVCDWLRRCRSVFGNPRNGAKQSELVRRGLLVREDDPADQRQSSAAIIWHAKANRGPVHLL